MPEPSAERCPDCGAQLGPGEACNDLFNRMLALEWQAIGALAQGIPAQTFLDTEPGAEGLRTHFFAVGTYQLQHPDWLVPEAVAGLLSSIEAVLAGKATLAETRLAARRSFNGPQRVRRREEGRDANLGPWPHAW